MFVTKPTLLKNYIITQVYRRLLLGRKAMTNPDSVLKSRDSSLLTTVGIVKALIFPVVLYKCDSSTIKKTERQRTDAFEMWCWRRHFWEFLWQQGDQPVNPKGNQPWTFIGRIGAEWSWNSNSLAIWCEEPTHWKRPWYWERLKARGEGGDRGWDG